MAARLQQKTKGLGGVMVRPTPRGGWAIGFVPDHRTKRLMTKRRRCREARMWRREEIQD